MKDFLRVPWKAIPFFPPPRSLGLHLLLFFLFPISCPSSPGPKSFPIRDFPSPFPRSGTPECSKTIGGRSTLLGIFRPPFLSNRECLLKSPSPHEPFWSPLDLNRSSSNSVHPLDPKKTSSVEMSPGRPANPVSEAGPRKKLLSRVR